MTSNIFFFNAIFFLIVDLLYLPNFRYQLCQIAEISGGPEKPSPLGIVSSSRARAK
jgi:hypothetical protein